MPLMKHHCIRQPTSGLLKSTFPPGKSGLKTTSLHRFLSKMLHYSAKLLYCCSSLQNVFMLLMKHSCMQIYMYKSFWPLGGWKTPYLLIIDSLSTFTAGQGIPRSGPDKHWGLGCSAMIELYIRAF